jgi:hypothetical protein
MDEQGTGTGWGKRIALGAGIVLIFVVAATLFVSRADGPLFIFQGGPFRSGELVAYDALDWSTVDDRTELELELVGAETSLTLWFSVTDGMAYVACDLDCEGGRLTRWPSEVREDDRVVIRIDGKRVEGRLTYVPHETPEYAVVKADRSRKYSGHGGVRAAAETAAHATVVEVGETLTGRAAREEPGDRVFRFDRR